ncbi:hypothetical protein [Octadecabacter sp. R77987]|uniref:head-tail connector protein n=1 Tax=Octadecabacter sp. R77987 TaxID=3093874 RepID=UPI00366A6E49
MMLVEETTVPPSALPVTQFKDHLRLGSGFSDDGLQDGLLESFLRAAMAAIEARTGKILIEREFSWTLTAWRDTGQQALPVAPVSAISEVVTISRLGDETVASAAGYRLEPDMQRPCLVATGGMLPAVPLAGSVRVGFLAGFGPDWSDLPADLAQAVMMLAAHYHEYRHETAFGGGCMPFGVSALIERYRTVRLFGGGRS